MRNYKYLGSGFYFFGETTLGFNYIDETEDDSTSDPSHLDETGYQIQLGFSPGVAYSLSRKWQLEVEFPNIIYTDYNHTHTNFAYAAQVPAVTQANTHEVNNGFDFSSSLTTNFSLEVGLRYVIGGK
jgi:hypothetical protein